MSAQRVLLVSNRLPVSITSGAGGAKLSPSSGGLATALDGVHAQGDGRWIGWLGDTSRVAEPARAQLFEQARERRLVPVSLSASDVALYYDGYSNSVLWPLFHYLLERVRLDATNEWRAYRSVNERFADVVARELAPGDVVWIHDYHLALLPALLRKRVPDARIGFFLHVPWPSSDVFRILPSREDIVTGLLGADLIGFHAESYRHNFVRSAAKVLGLDLGVDALSWEDRTVRVGVYPIGLDLATFERSSPEVDGRLAQLKARLGDKKVVLGVDRLDYTKGVPRRLMAIERLLEREPALRDTLHFIQLAVPTREKVDAYAELRRNVNELVGRINSQYGSPTSSPVQLLYRSVSADELLALYRAADVMLVTPLRDGMNLVAKEYVASRTDEHGALVLSEFAGAASELDTALIVNPYDIGAVASTVARALAMSPIEQRLRMRRLREAVKAYPVQRWSASFIEDLAGTAPLELAPISIAEDLEGAFERLRHARHRTLMLDYDGTLVPIASLPDLASPDHALLELLRALAASPETSVHVITGRSRASIEPWLGALPIAIHAEHGFWSRDAKGTWTRAFDVTPDFLAPALEILQAHAARTPGAFVETKSASAAFHYRRADPHLAEARVRSLRTTLTSELGLDAELLEGHKVLEVRLRGVHKGVVAREVVASAPPGSLLFAAGDDRTDEDLFRELPLDAITLRVGPGTTKAGLRVASVAELRRLLSTLVATPAHDTRVQAPHVHAR